MIPKVIHYCWFGRATVPKLALMCIESWKQYLPDYELRLWDETTFDVSSNPYTKEAFEAKKYAFVSDYVRLYALYMHGGVYMDTDVEVLKSLDSLLKLSAFSGFETEKDVPTGIMASEPLGEWVKEMLNYYSDRHFRLLDGHYDTTTNVQIISGIMASNGLKMNNSYQFYKQCMHIFPKEYFCPKSRTGNITLTQNTYCIHHFAGSWLPIHLKVKKYIFSKIIGIKYTLVLVKLKRKIMKTHKH
jgi:hypothetical protein